MFDSPNFKQYSVTDDMNATLLLLKNMLMNHKPTAEELRLFNFESSKVAHNFYVHNGGGAQILPPTHTLTIFGSRLFSYVALYGSNCQIHWEVG